MFNSIQQRFSSSERLLSLFRQGFSVMDLAEPLLSLDKTAPSSEAQKLMSDEEITHLGVRQNGRVVGYVKMNDLLSDGDLSRFREFAPSELLDDTAGLNSVLDCLVQQDTAFVKILGVVSCVIRRRDLEKPPMRMWLYGIISLIEMNVTWAVQELYPRDAWIRITAPTRVEKAQILQDERKRRGQYADLFSCLQFSDKLRILIKETRHRELLHIKSRKEGERLIKRLETLRNNIAHAQPIVDDNWDAIKTLNESIEQIVSAKNVRELIQKIQEDIEPQHWGR